MVPIAYEPGFCRIILSATVMWFLANEKLSAASSNIGRRSDGFLYKNKLRAVDLGILEE